MLGHDLVPHHHHDDHIETASHHSNDDHHNHDDQEKEADDDHEGSPELFSYFTHAPYKATSNDVVIVAPEKTNTDQQTGIFSPQIEIHYLKKISVSHHPPDDPLSLFHFLSSSLPLRAPPAC